MHSEYAQLQHVHSRNAPDIDTALRAIRDATGDAFVVGEAYVPTSELSPYLRTLDVAFAFEPMNAGPDAERLRRKIPSAIRAGRIGWVLSNHDFQRFATRFSGTVRAAAMLFLSLPAPVFVFQGDEIGLPDGPGVEPPLDRAGRDRFRHPMQWDASRNGGFTAGTPWLPPIDPDVRSVEMQEHDSDSILWLYRRMIELRGELGPGLRFLDSPPGTVVLERGEHLVAVNFGEGTAPVSRRGALVVEARPGDGADPDALPPHGGWIARKGKWIARKGKGGRRSS
jgi:alpha-glucosidase